MPELPGVSSGGNVNLFLKLFYISAVTSVALILEAPAVMWAMVMLLVLEVW